MDDDEKIRRLAHIRSRMADLSNVGNDATDDLIFLCREELIDVDALVALLDEEWELLTSGPDGSDE